MWQYDIIMFAISGTLWCCQRVKQTSHSLICRYCSCFDNNRWSDFQPFVFDHSCDSDFLINSDTNFAWRLKKKHFGSEKVHRDSYSHARPMSRITESLVDLGMKGDSDTNLVTAAGINNTMSTSSADPVLGQRLRRWPSTGSALEQILAFHGIADKLTTDCYHVSPWFACMACISCRDSYNNGYLSCLLSHHKTSIKSGNLGEKNNNRDILLIQCHYCYNYVEAHSVNSFLSFYLHITVLIEGEHIYVNLYLLL